MNENEGAVVLRNRLIAFLDVLGFAALLKTRELTDLHQEYAAFVDVAREKTFYGTEGDANRTNFAHAQIISDSIILVSHATEDVYNVNNFVGAVSFLLEAGYVAHFPLRGAISYGDFLLDEKRQIFLSTAFVEAVKYEGQQQLVGCALLDSAKDVVMEAAFGKKSLVEGVDPRKDIPIVKYAIPLHNGEEDERWCVNFTFFLTEDSLSEGLAHLISPKKENFEKFLEFMRWLPYQERILGPEFLPAKGCRMMATRSGFRVQFLDVNGLPCNPGVDRITWTAVGRWRD